MKKIAIVFLCVILSVLIFGCSEPDDLGEGAADNESVPHNEQETYNNDTENVPEVKQETSTDTTKSQEQPEESEEHSSVVADSEILPWGLFPYSFTTEDIHGNTVTEESLGEKQLFFVHLWATWCPPCVEEMPDLAAVAREYGDRVGFLGLLEDFETNPDGAKNIMESSDKPDFFITIDARDSQVSGLLELLNTGYVPTTVLFTSDGDMFEPLVGAFGYGYADILEAILEG